MSLRLVLAVLACVSCAPHASAQTVVSPDAFEALAEGRTLYFTRNGQSFGAEQFFSGRRSLWRFSDAFCEAGGWAAQGDLICFSYDSAPEPICWLFLQEGSGYTAAQVEDGRQTGLRLDLERIDTAPLPCPGPQVGS